MFFYNNLPVELIFSYVEPPCREKGYSLRRNEGCFAFGVIESKELGSRGIVRPNDYLILELSKRIIV